MFQNLNVLYVEDDPLSRQALDIILRRVMGAKKVWIFEDSTSFADRVQALPTAPDIIFLDIHVKPHSGFDMLKILREDLNYKDTRIVALTASVMSEEVSLLKRSGFDGGIGKPIQVATFPTVTQRILDGENVWHISDV